MFNSLTVVFNKQAVKCT